MAKNPPSDTLRWRPGVGEWWMFGERGMGSKGEVDVAEQEHTL